MPWGMATVVLFMLLAIFLRSSSIPTGIPHHHLFLVCNVSLVVAFAYLVLNWKLLIDPTALVFAMTAGVSVMVAGNQADSAMRWLGWFLMFGTIGPLFANELRLKLGVLNWTRRTVLALTVGSMVVNLLGVRLSGRGMFFGLMGHTMLLAPIAALASLDLFCTLKGKQTRGTALLLFVCCVTCIGAGSRGAVLGLGCGVLTHVAQKKQGIIVLLLTGLSLAGIHYLGPQSDRQEVGTNLSTGVYSELMVKGTNNTREFLWDARIREFRSSPIFGIGFQQQHISRATAVSKDTLEPGSSYLATLSMTGIVGGVGFLLVFLKALSVLFGGGSTIPSGYRDLLRGWAVFFSVHMVVEGYVFACGSVLCFLLWLTLGTSLSLDHIGKMVQQRKQIESRIHRQRKAA